MCPRLVCAMLADGSRDLLPCCLEDGHAGVCQYDVRASA